MGFLVDWYLHSNDFVDFWELFVDDLKLGRSLASSNPGSLPHFFVGSR